MTSNESEDGLAHMEPKKRLAIQSEPVRWLIVIASIYVLLVAVGLIGKGFRMEFGDAEGVESLSVFLKTERRVDPYHREHRVC